ncbi:class I adenylate cyclase [Endothiovibrio diazotrophicus]
MADKPDAKALRALLRRYLAINEQRLKRTYEFLKPDQQAFLDLLPLLFHTNHPELPGYVDEETPAGLAEYQPSNAALAAAKALSRGFSYQRRAHRSFPIQSLFAMGSAGTVAYSEKSDFDMWLCHAPDLPPEALEKLQAKCTAIEQWGDSLGLEVHFFLMNAERFRGGEQVALSSESSGTAQYHFLLDEFYRTGLLLGGRFPVWWLVPPEEEGEYDVYVQRLYDEEIFHPNEVIDFGGLGHIPASEFYGASVWQVYKGIGSPYKSVLKILLMEAYTSEFPTIELLSVRFKRVVRDGESDPALLDPYLMLMTKLKEYLEGQGDGERLDLARRCFYFKVDAELSRARPRPHEVWRFEQLSGLTVAWGWDRAWLYTLDSRPTWKVERVLEERKALFGALTQSYQALSDFARRQAGAMMIDPKDLDLLGRKLYSAFKRKAGKIELINPGISADLAEERLTFFHQRGEHQAWFLYRDDASDAAKRKRQGPIKHAANLVELIAWCHFNGVLERRTQLFAYANRGGVDLKQIQEVVTHLQRLFPGGEIPEPSMEDFARPERIERSAAVVNAGIDSGGSMTPSGLQGAQGGDIFNHGPTGENLVRSVDLLMINSWHEILTHHFAGPAAALDAVAEYLRVVRPLENRELPPIDIRCFSFFQGTGISQKMQRLFSLAVPRMQALGEGERLRLVARIGRSYHLLEADRDGAVVSRPGAIEPLLGTLAAPSERRAVTLFDGSVGRDTPLPVIFGQHKTGAIQLFYNGAAGQAEVYVVDEQGSLFHQVQPYHDAQTLLIQFHRFFSAVLPRRDAALNGDPLEHSTARVEYYQLRRDKKWDVRRVGIDESRQAQRYFNVQVIGESGDDGAARYTIYCDHEEFSSFEHGNRLFTEIARYVLERRRGGERYPIYITDIDISRLLHRGGRGPLQTIQFLNYKARIEERLNSALQGL